MGSVDVMVGCPHRLRAPIGCDACAIYGPPGWPRWAIAMTVDYGPRLSRAAVKGATVNVSIPPPRPALTPQALFRAVRLLDYGSVTHKRVMSVAEQVVIEQGDLNVVTHSQSEEERRANLIRMTVSQPIRFRFR